MASSFLRWKKDIKITYVCQDKNTYLRRFSSYLLKLIIPLAFWKVKVGKAVSSVAKIACTGYIENPWRDPQSYLNLQTLTERKFVTETKTFRPPASRKTTEESL